jgi:Flp pilus assembly protein TadG
MALWCHDRKRCYGSAAALAAARSTGPGKDRTAAATVEFAVVAPVFFLVMLGLVEVGRGLMVQHLLLNAARQGARTGILPSNGKTDVTNAVSNTLAPAGITAQTVTITVNDASGDPANANSGDDIGVQVQVPISAITWVPVTNFLSGNISAQYTLRRQ